MSHYGKVPAPDTPQPGDLYSALRLSEEGGAAIIITGSDKQGGATVIVSGSDMAYIAVLVYEDNHIDAIISICRAKWLTGPDDYYLYEVTEVLYNGPQTTKMGYTQEIVMRIPIREVPPLLDHPNHLVIEAALKRLAKGT